jgi:hypothetical protein
LFEELRSFSNRAKKKNVLEFIRFLPNFQIFKKKNELSRVYNAKKLGTTTENINDERHAHEIAARSTFFAFE